MGSNGQRIFGYFEAASMFETIRIRLEKLDNPGAALQFLDELEAERASLIAQTRTPFDDSYPFRQADQ